MELHGTVAEIEARWLAFQKACPEPSSLSLTILRDASKLGYEQCEDLTVMLDRSKLPFEHLQSLHFEAFYAEMHKEVFKYVVRGAQLKKLHWEYFEESTNYFFLTSRVGHQREIALRQLEELTFDVSSDIIIDESVVSTICGRLKRIYLIRGMEREIFLSIIESARWTLEEIVVENITRTIKFDYIGLMIPVPSTSFSMRRLKTVCIQDRNVLILNITAPNATDVRFDHVLVVDWTLIDSCRGRLKTLHIETKGFKTEGRLAEELFDMPELEELHLDFNRGDYRENLEDYKGRVTGYDLCSVAAFWQVVCSNNAAQVQSILPKLMKLTIIHDPMLDEALFLKYLSLRALAGQFAIEKIDIYLANHCSMKTSELRALRPDMKGFSYKGYKHWKIQDTRPWSLMNKLHFNGVFVKWDLIDACQNILQSLQIHLENIEVNSRIETELFDMPQLEILVLNFSKTEGYIVGEWSAIALWKALSTGITDNEVVPIQNILPKLKELTVINDATLNQDKIISMISTRKKIGLKSIQSIDIALAKKFYGDGCANLDELKESHPGLSYHCITKWEDYLHKTVNRDA